jgi:hypothetical protein
MKKTFIILIFVVAISTSAPSNPVLIQRARHLIEYSQDNKKEASSDELLKQKVISYMRVEVLKIKIQLIEKSFTTQYNSS